MVPEVYKTLRLLYNFKQSLVGYVFHLLLCIFSCGYIFEHHTNFSKDVQNNLNYFMFFKCDLPKIT